MTVSGPPYDGWISPGFQDLASELSNVDGVEKVHLITVQDLSNVGGRGAEVLTLLREWHAILAGSLPDSHTLLIIVTSGAAYAGKKVIDVIADIAKDYALRKKIPAKTVEIYDRYGQVVKVVKIETPK